MTLVGITASSRIGLYGEEAVDSGCQLGLAHGILAEGVYGEAYDFLTYEFGLLEGNPDAAFERTHRGILALGTGICEVHFQLEPGVITTAGGGATFEVREDGNTIVAETLTTPNGIFFPSWRYDRTDFQVKEGSLYTVGYTMNSPVLIGVYQSGTGGYTMIMGGPLNVGGNAQPMRRNAVVDATING